MKILKANLLLMAFFCLMIHSFSAWGNQEETLNPSEYSRLEMEFSNAVLLLNDTTPNVSKDKARETFEIFQNRKDLPEKMRMQSKLYLSYMRLHGIGGEKNTQGIRQVYQLLEKNQTLGPHDKLWVKFDLAHILYNGIDGNTQHGYARKLYKELAENENLSKEKRAQSRYWLAYMNLKGLGGRPNSKNIRATYEALLKDQNLPFFEKSLAKFQMAHILFNGIDGRPNHPRARKLWQELLLNDHLPQERKVRSRFWLMYMNLKGFGGCIKHEKIRSICEGFIDHQALSADERTSAKLHLASILRKGIDGAPDLPRARRIYEELIQDHTLSLKKRKQAEFHLAEIKLKHASSPEDHVEIRAQFEKFINDQLLLPLLKVRAKVALAYILFQGIDGERDFFRAENLAQQLIRHSNVESEDYSQMKYILAHVKLYGRAGLQNHIKIRELYETLLADEALKSIRNMLQCDYAYILSHGIDGDEDKGTARKYLEKLLKTENPQWLDYKIRYELAELDYRENSINPKYVVERLQSIQNDLNRRASLSYPEMNKICAQKINDLLARMKYLGHGTEAHPLAKRTQFLSFDNNEEYGRMINLLDILHPQFNEEKITKIINLMELMHGEKHSILGLTNVLSKLVSLSNERFETIYTMIRDQKLYELWSCSVLLGFAGADITNDLNLRILLGTETIFSKHEFRLQYDFESYFKAMGSIAPHKFGFYLVQAEKWLKSIEKQNRMENICDVIMMYHCHGDLVDRWIQGIENSKISDDLEKKSWLLSYISQRKTDKAKQMFEYSMNFIQSVRAISEIDDLNSHLKLIDQLLPENGKSNIEQRCFQGLLGEDRKMASRICDFLEINRDVLGLYNGHDLLEQVMHTRTVLDDPMGGPYKIHEDLKKKKTVPVKWSMLRVQSENISLIPENIMNFSQEFRIDFESVPSIDSLDFIKTLEELEVQLQQNHELRQDANVLIERDLYNQCTIEQLIDEAKCMSSFFNRFLDSPLDMNVARLKHVIGYYQELQGREKWLGLSSFLNALRHCDNGRLENLNRIYNRDLPVVYHMKKVPVDLDPRETNDRGFKLSAVGQKECDGWNFIHSSIESYFAQCFEANQPFMRSLLPINQSQGIDQETHQIPYAKNLIGNLVGLHYVDKFDFHGHLTHPNLLQISQQKMLAAFYQNFNIEDFIQHLANKINFAIKVEEDAHIDRHSDVADQKVKPIQTSLYEILGKSVATYMEPVDESYTKYTLSREGVIYILKRAKIIVDHNQSTDMEIIGDNRTAEGQLKRRRDEIDDSGTQKRRRHEELNDEEG